MEKYFDCDIMTVRTLLRKAAIFFCSEQWLRYWLRLDSKINLRNILKGQTWVVYRTSIVYFFSLNSLLKLVKNEWSQLEMSSNKFFFLNYRTTQPAQSQVLKHTQGTTNAINGHYKVKSPSTKQMVSNECHNRECQVYQSRASESTKLTVLRKYDFPMT